MKRSKTDLNLSDIFSESEGTTSEVETPKVERRPRSSAIDSGSEEEDGNYFQETVLDDPNFDVSVSVPNIPRSLKLTRVEELKKEESISSQRAQKIDPALLHVDKNNKPINNSR